MLTRLVRRVRVAGRARRGDDGTSLTELLVAMGLASLLGALTLGLVVNVNSSATATTDRSIGAAQARTVLLAWTSYLRVSDGLTAGSSSHRFEWLTSTSTLFYADLNNRSGTTAASPPTMIWLRFDATNKALVEEQFSLPVSYPAAPRVCRVLAQNVTTLTITGYTSGGITTLGSSLAPSDVAGQPCRNLVSSVSQTVPAGTITSVGLDFTITATDGTRPQRYTGLATLPQLGS